MTQIDAVLTAGGGNKPSDPLYPFTQGKPKALLPIAGKPMVQWVLDALAACDQINRVVVIGLQPEHGLTAGSKVLDYLPDTGNLVDNMRTGLERVLQLNPQANYALGVSADIPGLRAEHVNWLIDTCLQTDHDAYYALIERQVMEARYPTSRRTYTHLKGKVVCGGDMNLFATRLVRNDPALWQRITAARKNVFKQASLIGLEMLFLLAVRQLTIERATQQFSQRLSIRGRVVLCPYAEVGMDVDKPSQYAMMEKDLASHLAPL